MDQVMCDSGISRRNQILTNIIIFCCLRELDETKKLIDYEGNIIMEKDLINEFT